MGKRLIVILAMVSMFKLSFSQISVSFNAGFNHDNIMYSDYLKNSIPSYIKDIRTGTLNSYSFGALVNYDLNKKFSLQSGLFYTGKGGTISLTYMDVIVPNDRITPFYLEMPFNFMYNYKNFQFFVGPYLNLGLAGTTHITGEVIDYGSIYDQSRNIKFGTTDSADLRPFNYGLNAGVGYKYKNFLFRVQYQLGKTDLRINLPSVSVTVQGLNMSTPAINQTYLLFSSTLTFSVGYVLFEDKAKKHKR